MRVTPELPFSMCLEVFFNGGSLQYCTMADDSLGTVTVYKIDESGNPVIDFEKDEIVEVQYFGAVEIRLKEDAPSWAKEMFEEFARQ